MVPVLRAESVVGRKAQLDLMGHVWNGPWWPWPKASLSPSIRSLPSCLLPIRTEIIEVWEFMIFRQSKECGAKERIERSGSPTKQWNKKASEILVTGGHHVIILWNMPKSTSTSSLRDVSAKMSQPLRQVSCVRGGWWIFVPTCDEVVGDPSCVARAPKIGPHE